MAPTIQMLPKLAKNILTLGIRKIYVNYKRKKRAAAAAPVQIVPVIPAIPPVNPYRTNSPLTAVQDEYATSGEFTLEELYEHLTAYEKARYFHATKDRNVASIADTGLQRRFGGSAEGASATADPRSVPTNKGKIFVGGDRTTALYYERQVRADKTATPETLRVFVTPDAAEDLTPDFGDDDNEAYYTTGFDVPANQILRGKFADASREQLLSIFEAVRLWYPNPSSVDAEEVAARHMEAIQRGLTVHRKRPGRLGRGRFIRDVKNPKQGGYGDETGYESD